MCKLLVSIGPTPRISWAHVGTPGSFIRPLNRCIYLSVHFGRTSELCVPAFLTRPLRRAISPVLRGNRTETKLPNAYNHQTAWCAVWRDAVIPVSSICCLWPSKYGELTLSKARRQTNLRLFSHRFLHTFALNSVNFRLLMYDSVS